MTIEDIHTFQELAKQNSYEYKILGQPEVRWIKIEDTYGIEVEYVRNGANNSRTHVCNYYFNPDYSHPTRTMQPYNLWAQSYYLSKKVRYLNHRHKHSPSFRVPYSWHVYIRTVLHET